MIRQYRESPMDVFIHYAGVTAVASVTVAAFAFMAVPSRYITRLSLIRSKPTTGGETRVFWRMRHAGHEMFSETSKRSQPRDIAIENLNIKMLYSGGSEFRRLNLFMMEEAADYQIDHHTCH